VLKRSIISKFNRALHADVIVMKPRVSALYCTDLEAPLQANTMQRFVLAGVSTAWAVQATACDAHDRDYQWSLWRTSAPPQARKNIKNR
jgi:nicotinamidase-related amidase